MDRRKFIYAGLCAVTVVLGGLLAYFATRPPKVIEKTVSTTVEKSITTTVEKTPTMPSSGVNISQIKEIKRIITTKVEGTLVEYREEMFFSKSDFSKILMNKDELRSLVASRFEERISGYRVYVSDIKVGFGNNSVVLTCCISGAISKTDSRYYATFEWLIRPFDLDFIDSHFKESEEGLYWEGEINGVCIVIDAKFPNIGKVYEAWGHPTGHCHAHVWWEL